LPAPGADRRPAHTHPGDARHAVANADVPAWHHHTGHAAAGLGHPVQSVTPLPGRTGTPTPAAAGTPTPTPLPGTPTATPPAGLIDVNGAVVDATTGNPLPGARVEVVDASGNVVTTLPLDAVAGFGAHDVPPGSYTLRVTAPCTPDVTDVNVEVPRQMYVVIPIGVERRLRRRRCHPCNSRR
jgi:Carboxypeptidase regulatory-like domain